MSARGERNRQARSASMLTMAPAPEDPWADELRGDAAARHALARSRRERKRNPLLAADPQPQSRPEPSARPRVHPGDVGRDIDRLVPAADVEPASHADDRPDHYGGPDVFHAANDEAGVPVRQASRPAIGRVVGLTLIGALAGASFAFLMPASHVATAELLIDPAGDGRSAGQLSPDAAFALVDNQIRVLKSGTMLGAVADRLNLASDGDFLGSGLFGQVTGLVSGEPARVDGRQRAIEALSGSLEIERVAGSSAITVSARSADAAKSALVVNTLADLYVAGSGTVDVGEPAAARLESLRTEVETAERAVETYKAENELVDAQGRLISDEQILALGEQLSAAKARTVELNARAASTREANVDSIVTGSLPEQFASPTVSDLRDRYAGLKQQMDRIATRLGPRHPERLAAEAELQGTREELGSELRRVAGAVQTELKRAVQQEQELASELARMKVRQGQIGDEMIGLRELEGVAESRRAAYQDALRGSQVAAAGITADARILSRADPSAAASGRPFGAFSLAGALGGLLLGLGLSQRRHKDPQDDADEDAEHASEQAASATNQGSTKAGLDDRASRKENDTMYPYPYQPGYPAAPSGPTQQGQPYAQPAQGHAHPAPQPAGWQQMPQPGMMPQQVPAHQSAMPMAPAGYPQPGMQGWAPMPPAQAYQPVDPWAHLRGYPQPQPYAPSAFAQPAYAPPQPVFIYQTVPVQQPVEQTARPAPREQAPARAAEPPVQRSAPREERHRRHEPDRFEQDRYVDDHTNAAIEEIRQSLREFREAIEDLADDRFRERDRYYGT
jgi:succinoglycan biosynthesis transport protein ExoP